LIQVYCKYIITTELIFKTVPYLPNMLFILKDVKLLHFRLLKNDWARLIIFVKSNVAVLKSSNRKFTAQVI